MVVLIMIVNDYWLLEFIPGVHVTNSAFFGLQPLLNHLVSENKKWLTGTLLYDYLEVNSLQTQLYRLGSLKV